MTEQQATEQQDTYRSITVAQARAAVQASGLLEGVEGPQFLAPDSADWLPYFRGAGDAHPDFARLIVTRVGQHPREVVISWDEYAEQMDSDAEWDAIREKKPMAVFGAEAERHAYKVVFPDVMADLLPARETIVSQRYDGTEQVYEVPARNWLFELEACADLAKLDALFEQARSEKVLTDPVLHEAFGRRLRELVAVQSERSVAPMTVAAPSPAAVAARVKPLTVEAPRRPQGQRPRRRRGPRE